MVNKDLKERYLRTERWKDIAEEFRLLPPADQLRLQEELLQLSEFSVARVGLLNLDKDIKTKETSAYVSFKKQLYILEKDYETVFKTWEEFKNVVSNYLMENSKQGQEYHALPEIKKVKYWKLIKYWYDRLVNEGKGKEDEID